MSKSKKSGSAILMYLVIAGAAVIAAICFPLYYGSFLRHPAVLWTGVTAITVLYHLWVRLLFGVVTTHLPIRHTHAWFRERRFEPALYRLLRVKVWKDKALTYRPEEFSLKDRTLEEIANTMAKSETDHWINELISLSTLLFSLIWGAFPVFLITAILAMLFDAQFIVIQRYNRSRIQKILNKKRVSHV